MREKDDGSYDSLTSWDESPDFTKKQKRPKKPTKKNKKMREKREGAMLLFLFPHLCFKVAP